MTELSATFHLKVLHYTSDQVRLLKRKECLWVEPPPADFEPHLQHLLKKSQNQISAFLAHLLYQSDKHLEGFTEFSYEITPGGAMGHTQVKTYIFLFKRPSNNNVIEPFILEDGFT